MKNLENFVLLSVSGICMERYRWFIFADFFIVDRYGEHSEYTNLVFETGYLLRHFQTEYGTGLAWESLHFSSHGNHGNKLHKLLTSDGAYGMFCFCKENVVFCINLNQFYNHLIKLTLWYLMQACTNRPGVLPHWEDGWVKNENKQVRK